MAMKSIKNTSISVELLNAPVKIYSAASAEQEVKFSLCGPEGERLKQVYVKEGTDEIVPWDEIGRSYEGIQIDKEELDRITAESLKDENGNSLESIRIQSFVPIKDLPMERVTATYLLGPDLKVSNGEAFEHLVAGLKRRKAAGIAKVVLKSRQKLLAIFVENERLYAVVIAFAAQVANVDDSELRAAKVVTNKKVTAMMAEMIVAMTETAGVIEAQEDTFVTHKRELVEQVVAGQPVKESKPAKEPSKNQSGELLEALEESIKLTEGKKVNA